jgi:hypothetical protein
MARFSGVIGYGHSRETVPGVWVDEITERKAKGTVIRNSRGLKEGDKVNNDLSVGNSISILGNPYAYENFFAMRYIKWMGSLWVVSNVDVERPRLILRLGGVYNGPTPGPTQPSP